MRKLLTASLLFCVLHQVYAQNTRLWDDNSLGWLANFTTLKFSKKWSGHLEVQLRREGLVRLPQQNLYRTGINYNVTDQLQLRAGYAFAETANYGDFPLQGSGKSFPEHRSYFAATLSNKIGRVGVSQRLIAEQRWVGRYNTAASAKVDDWVYSNRGRWQLRLQLPLNRQELQDNTLYAAAFNEVFIGFGKNVGENIFDQNRSSVLLGYRFSKSFRMEAGYLKQIVQLGREINGRNVFQNNNAFVVNTYLDVDLSR